MNKHVKFVQRFLRNRLKKRRVLPASHINVFLQNLEWIILGKRPAFCPERVVLQNDVLLELLTEVAPLVGGARAGNPENDVCILILGDHTFITNAKNCALHLEAIAKSEQPKISDTVFININKANDKPTIIAQIEDLNSVMEACLACSAALRSILHGNNIIEVPSTTISNVNLCTLFGCILGYPVVYYFDEENGENCLSMVPLNVVKILEYCNNGMQLVSFSYPKCLEDDVETAVECWCEKVTGGDESVVMKEDVAEMPYVVL